MSKSRINRVSYFVAGVMLVFSPTVAFARAHVQMQAGSFRQEISASDAMADFDILVRALQEAHGGYDRFRPRAEVDRRLATHRARLSRAMSKRSFAGIVAEAITELRDGHARLEFDSITNVALAEARLFPLRIQLEGSRMVVLFNDTPSDSTIQPGVEISNINGRSTEELRETLQRTVSGDGFIETGRRARLARDFARFYWLFVDQPDSFTVTVRHGGRSFTRTLAGVRDRERNTANPVNATIVQMLERLDGPRGNISLDLLDRDIARLRIRAFGGAAFGATLDSVIRIVREKEAKALILDLRGNGGGVDEYGALLVSQFVDRPFRYFDRIQITTRAPSFATWLPRTFEAVRAGTQPDGRGGFLVTAAYHSGVGEQQPARAPYRGKLIVLIDGGSFSTTADVAAQLRSMRRATFVGEETAGTYEGNTSGLNALVVLPNSGLRLKIMMYGYWNAVSAPQQRGRGTLPDYTVVRRVSDLLAGNDPVLKRAIELAR